MKRGADQGRLGPILAAAAAARAGRRRVREHTRSTAEPVERGEGARFVEALRGPQVSLIAELKRRSPTAGELLPEDRLGETALDRARGYAAGGAAVLSILTEGSHFHGSPADLEAVRPAGLPRLRKDFLLGPDCITESVLFGADAVLLIARLFEPTELFGLTELARQLELGTLVEVHDEVELEAAIAARPDAIGVNGRDLSTFVVDAGAHARMLPRIPAEFIAVAESGLRTRNDVRRAVDVGARAVLVGEALMRASDPRAAAERLMAVTP